MKQIELVGYGVQRIAQHFVAQTAHLIGKAMRFLRAGWVHKRELTNR